MNTFALVRREPTEEMLNAGYEWGVSDWPENWSDGPPEGITPELYTATHIWPAMLAASPAPTEDEISALAEMANRLCGFNVTHEQMAAFIHALGARQ